MKILRTGMVSSVGASAPACNAAIRAGVSSFEEIPVNDRFGHPVVSAIARNVIPGKLGIHLLASMSAQTIEEALGSESLTDMPLLVAISPGDQPGRPEFLERMLLPAISAQFGMRLHPDSRVIAKGSTGTFRALAKARGLFKSGRAEKSLVCGVDSLATVANIGALDRTGRLKTVNNPDGMIPGEAAASLLVAPTEINRESDVATIRGLGFACEPVGIFAAEPNLGVGLAGAIQAALDDADLTVAELGYRIADVTGERYGMNEANYALGRVLKMRKVDFDFLHLADCIGAVGAASGACMLTYLKHLFDQGLSPYRGVLCHCASDDGDRAALIVVGPRQG
jgi:3-oxoacyl-[acyl-carrier-protein] synthase-1